MYGTVSNGTLIILALWFFVLLREAGTGGK